MSLDANESFIAFIHRYKELKLVIVEKHVSVKDHLSVKIASYLRCGRTKNVEDVRYLSHFP